MPVSVQMGTLTLTASQLMNLKPGDVIPLNKSVSTQLDVFVENKRKFGGSPASIRSARRSSITTVYSDETEA